MNPLLKIGSLIALLLVTIPSVLYFTGVIDHSMVLTTALVGTVVWFVATPLWMLGKEEDPLTTEANQDVQI